MLPNTEYCKTYIKKFFNQENVSYPCIENKASKLFRTPYFHEIFNMFHTLEDDSPKCFIPPLTNPANVSYPGTKHSNRVCRLKNEPPLKDIFSAYKIRKKWLWIVFKMTYKNNKEWYNQLDIFPKAHKFCYLYFFIQWTCFMFDQRYQTSPKIFC